MVSFLMVSFFMVSNAMSIESIAVQENGEYFDVTISTNGIVETNSFSGNAQISIQCWGQTDSNGTWHVITLSGGNLCAAECTNCYGCFSISDPISLRDSTGGYWQVIVDSTNGISTEREQ